MKYILAALAVLAPLSLLAAGNAPNHPTGTNGLFLVDKLGAHVRFFDPVTFLERSNLKLPANPHDFVFSPDHTRAYVPIYGSGVYNRNPDPKHYLYVIDLARRAVERVVIDELIELAGSASMPQVRAVATLKLQRRATELMRTASAADGNGQAQAADAATVAHANLLAADVKRFLERPATAVAVRMAAPAIPPGAPIGEPAMEWLRRIEPPCSWHEGAWWD